MVNFVDPEGGSREALILRDQWDRPLVLPPTGHKADCAPRRNNKGGCTCMTGYTRVSTMAETLSDSFGLNRWQKGNMLKGIAKRPDIVNAARIAANPSELYELVDLAETLGDNDVAARNGSTMHRLTELDDQGLALPDDLPDNIEAMLDAYRKERDRLGLVTLDTEGFVVQDKIKVAGSFDKKVEIHKGELEGRCAIVDVKTGQRLNYLALKVTMQVAMYAAGAYCPDQSEPDRLPLGVDRDHGLLIWLPWVDDPKKAKCEIRRIDLAVGRKAVAQALKVRGLRGLKADQILPRLKG